MIALSALLFYLSFPNILSSSGFYFLAWIFAIPLFFVLDQQNFNQRILTGLCFGLAANLLTLNWMIPYSLLGYIFLCLILSVQAVIFTLLYRGRAFCKVLYVPAAWVTSEWVRKLLMLGESWDLGHTQVFNLEFVQIANIFGSASVSFVLIFINYGLYRIIRRSDRVGFLHQRSTIFIVAGLVYLYGFYSLQCRTQEAASHLRICAIEPHTDFHQQITDRRVENILAENIALTERALQGQYPDLVVWPETAIPDDIINTGSYKDGISKFVKTKKIPFLIGTASEDDSRLYNSALLFNNNGEPQQVYHKHALIPLTEYIPSQGLWPVFAKVFKVQSAGFSPGETSGLMEFAAISKHTKNLAGIAICSEDNIAGLFRKYVNAGAKVVLVLLNNGWFSQESGLVMHGQHSVMRAIENGVPVVRVSNTGWTCAIDSSGRIMAASQEQSYKEKKFYHFSIPLTNRRTLYRFLGDTFCFLCLSFVIINSIVCIYRRDP